MQQNIFGVRWLFYILVLALFQGCFSGRNSRSNLPIDEVAVDMDISTPKAKRKKSGRNTAPSVVHHEKATTKTPSTTAKEVKPPSNTPTAGNQNIKVEKLLTTARSYLGTPYKPGGITRTGVDCSGFVMVSFREIGVTLPRTSREQSEFGEVIHRHELRPGDLIFFATGKTGTVGHSGLVLERNQQTIRFIHAANTGVRIDELSSDYWNQRYLKARRVFQ